MRKVIITKEACDKNNISPSEFFLLCYVSRGNFEIEKDIDSLKKKGLVTSFANIEQTPAITQEGNEFIGKVLIDSQTELPSEVTIKNLATSLREIYPEGKKDGYYWRSSQKEIEDKLRRFFVTFGTKWSPEQIISATKNYVDNNKNNIYMRILKYFILKDGRSDLAEYLENYGSEEKYMTDFTTNLV